MALEPLGDAEIPRSPEWWLLKLATQLHERRRGTRGRERFTRRGVASSKVRPPLELLDDYLRGDPPLRDDIHGTWSAPFRQFLRMGRMNVAPLLVSSVSSRLSVRDFRTSAGDDDLGDVKAREIMRANKMRPKMRDTHDGTFGHGSAYVLVTPPDRTRSRSLMTKESALNCITHHDPATGRTEASLKMYRDDTTETDWAFLYLTDDPENLDGEMWVARADAPASTLFGRAFVLSDQWRWDTDRFETIPGTRNPMVPFENKDGRSELEGYLDTLDRINDKLFNEWWIGKIQAFRQRALLLADTAEEEDDEELAEQVNQLLEKTPDVTSMTDSELSSMFTSAPDGFWTLPLGAKLWESTPTDVRPLIESVKAELQWLAAVKSIPLHVITPDAANGSAEGASTMKEEQIFLIEDRADRLEASWVEVLSLCFEYEGDLKRADASRLEVIWAPFERYSLEQKSDAASKLQKVLPEEILWTDILQMAPADVTERVRPAQARALFLNAVAVPAPGQRATQPAPDSAA